MNSDDKLLSDSQEEQVFLAQEAKNDLLTFCQLIDKKFEAVWFHEVIASVLERALASVVAKGKARIILTIPPRHGKTQLAARYFPAWALGKYPDLQFILSTYGSDLSEKSGQATRDVITSDTYQAIFPETTLRPDSKAKAKWMTQQHGSYTAVGIGGPVTGTGANIILLDDPHKDRAEAESATMRENVHEYYRSTLYSRLEGAGAVILIMQRWHTDDLVGRILEESKANKEAGEPYDEWEVINFPAIAEEDEPKRKKGESLWPSKFPVEVLDNIRQTAGTYNWSSQYMQDPILAENQEFKENMFKYFQEEDIKDQYLRYYTMIDPAISQKKDADNTVVLTVAKQVNGPNIYRIREDAGHFTPSQTVDLIFKHQQMYKSEVYLETVAYQLALKYSLEEEMARKDVYFMVNEVKTTTNKEVRVRGLLPRYEVGVIYHRKTDTQYEKELLQFPRSRHDDRADAMGTILNYMQNTPTSFGSKVYKPKWMGYGRKK